MPTERPEQPLEVAPEAAQAAAELALSWRKRVSDGQLLAGGLRFST